MHTLPSLPGPAQQARRSGAAAGQSAKPLAAADSSWARICGGSMCARVARGTAALAAASLAASPGPGAEPAPHGRSHAAQHDPGSREGDGGGEQAPGHRRAAKTGTHAPRGTPLQEAPCPPQAHMHGRVLGQQALEVGGTQRHGQRGDAVLCGRDDGAHAAVLHGSVCAACARLRSHAHAGARARARAAAAHRVPGPAGSSRRARGHRPHHLLRGASGQSWQIHVRPWRRQLDSAQLCPPVLLNGSEHRGKTHRAGELTVGKHWQWPARPVVAAAPRLP